ncbi:hypothetical protein LRAMOSA02438 [Lichtheimia ramosa]|uniref:BTB domain-containing protein n=1 Tax=Lichtheimia ramosa TaxID=688394 RepID=A0A077WQA6_9FUNG|nr:hypothetical protein LRAMOSA02438 [Lichtheimia ramosa]
MNQSGSNSNNNADPYGLFNFDYPLQFDTTDLNGNELNDSLFPGAPIPDNFLQFMTSDTAPSEQHDPNVTAALVNNEGSMLNDAQMAQASLPLGSSASTQNKRSSSSSSSGDTAQQQAEASRKRPRIQEDDEPSNQATYVLVVGGRPFRLSWESLKSDGPNNFFTNFFRKRKTTRVMHIDRDPDIFALIVHHLRGYHIRPRDDVQNQALVCDAEYYGLKRLTAFLQEHVFLNVGGRVFRLPWSLLKKDGGSRNFFTGPIQHQVFNPATGHGAQNAPIYIDRDPDIFADIVNHLRGYTIHIRDEVHHKNLLKDAQYYALRNLREKLLTSQQTLDGFGDQRWREVLLLLQDVRLVNVLPPNKEGIQRLCYKRDDSPHALLVQLSEFVVQVHKDGKLTMDLGVKDKHKLQEISQAVSLEGIHENRVILDEACAMTVDDRQVRHIRELDHWENWETCQKCDGDECRVLKLSVLKAIAGVQVQDSKLILCLVRFVAISSRFQLNMKREFLPT